MSELSEGDTVLVRVRKHRTSGPLRAKFVAEVEAINTIGMSTVIKLGVPFGALTNNYVRLREHEAEFEVVDSVSEVDF